MQSNRSLAGNVAIGTAVLSSMFFSGCGIIPSNEERIKSLKDHAENSISAAWVDRGEGIFFISDVKGDAVSLAIAEILKANPDKKILETVRTGRYDDGIRGGGTGFILILEDKEK